MDDPSTPSQFAGLVRRLHLGHRLLRAHLEEQLAETELSETEFLVLGACDRSDQTPAPQSALTSLVGLSPAQLSALVERLRQRGWLDVRRCSGDRRRQLLSLTAAGRDQLQRATDALNRHDDRLGLRFAPHHRQQLTLWLDHLIAACTGDSSLSDSEPLSIPSLSNPTSANPTSAKRGAAA